MKPYLQDKGFVLRAPEISDVDVMFQFENTPELWQYGNITGPYSKYALAQYVQESQNDLFVDRQLRLMIEDSEKKVVGIIDLFNFDPHNRRAEVGIVVGVHNRRQGIGAIALTLLSEYCFLHLALHQLYAYIDTDNEACHQLFVSCGYTPSAILKEWIHASGNHYRDVVLVQQVNPYQ